MDTGSQREVSGRAWTALALALLLHVIDEAATGFLSVYNPIVMGIRQKLPWLPLPVFRFDVWLGGLLCAVVLLLLLRRPLVRGARWMRRAAVVFAVLMIANAAGHVAGTIAGLGRPMPGFWSSPVLAAAAVWVLLSVRQSAAIQKSRG